MKKIEKYIGAVALTLLLVPQIKHTVFIFESNSQHDNAWFAWCYAIGIDLAILIFTLKGWTWTAVGYLLATLATNIAYQFFPIGLEAKILISALLSFTIFIFSHLYKTEKDEKNAEKTQGDLIREVNNLGIAIQINPHRCPACDKAYQTAKELNGHISGHKASKQGVTWTPKAYGNWEQNNIDRERFIQKNIKTIEEVIYSAA